MSMLDRHPLIRPVLTTMVVHVVVVAVAVIWPRWFGFSWEAYAFSDPQTYFNYATKISAGLIPYRDYLAEYPPLALLSFVPPLGVARLLVGLGVPVALFKLYVGAFATMMLVVDAGVIGLVAGQAARIAGDRGVRSALRWYSAFFLILCPLSVCRFDLIATLVAFAATVWLVGGRPIAGGVLTSVGVLVKFVPALVLLPVLVAPTRQFTVWFKVRAVLAAAVVGGLGVLGWWLVGGMGVVDSIRFHMERHIEVGSTYAGIFFVLNLVTDYPIEILYDHGAFGVLSAWTFPAAHASTWIQLGLFALVAARGSRLGRGGPGDPGPDRRATTIIRLTGAALLAYIVGGRVLSPQYLIWLFPFIAVAGGRAARWLFLVCCVLTVLIYPWNFARLLHHAQPAMVLVVVRNLGLWALLGVLLIGRDEATAAAHPVPD